MINAERTSLWKTAYRISVDGHQLTTFNAKWWGSGGWFGINGQHYELRANFWGTRWSLLGTDGSVIATAEGVHRKRWTVRTSFAGYQFLRDSCWKLDQSLVAADQRVGSVKIVSASKGNVVAELPGLPLPVQVFTLATVLTVWNAQFIPLLMILIVAAMSGA